MISYIRVDFRNAFYALSIPYLKSVINRRLQEDIQHILRLHRLRQHTAGLIGKKRYTSFFQERHEFLIAVPV